MSQEFLLRRLSFEGCRTVGRDLSLRLRDIHANKYKLPLVVEAEANHVIQRADDLGQFATEELSFDVIDQGADRAVAGFYGTFSAREMCFGAEDLVPFTDEERAHLAYCQETRQMLFPQGTAFIQGAPEDQWAGLVDLRQRLSFPQVQERLAVLACQHEAARLTRWIERYGQRLGVLPQAEQGRSLDAMLALDRFHAAWQGFSAEVRRAFKDNSPTHNQLRALLLSPYERQQATEEKAARALHKA